MMEGKCSMKLRLGLGLAVLLAASAVGWAQDTAPKRTKITGISHVAYYVSDLPAAMRFWHDFLGYDSYFELKKPGSQETRISFIRINDRQHVELFNEASTHPPNMLNHVAFLTDDAEQMKAYLKAQGVKVADGPVQKTKAGDLAFMIADPDGTKIEFVQRLADGVELKTAGKFEPDTRISTLLYHAGFVVGHTAKAVDFYSRVLGFKETWRGGGDPKVLSWINMKVPDGDDYVELMLTSVLPKAFGGKNHLSLAVPDIDKSLAVLQTRVAAAGYGKPLEIHTGVNRKRQMNMFDPDGTRVELMEPVTIDGKPTPPSTAPPPADIAN
jgi:catechol 2,3-dioxygenase-like lactoylglutathione lyase family enzyme